MHVRIISGKYGGRNIQAPDGKLTHPMSERVRGSLFNIIGDSIKNTDVLDAFSGSGALGLESISRGAKSAILIDRDRIASRIINENITNLGVCDTTKTIQIGLATWIDKNQDKRFDYIFADPPYNDMQLSTVSRLGGLLRQGGIMILSHPKVVDTLFIDNLIKTDSRSYGTATLSFYRLA